MGFPRWRTTMCFVSGRRRNVGSSTLKQVDFPLEAVGRGGFWVKRFPWIQWKSNFVMDWRRGKNMYDIYISIYYCDTSISLSLWGFHGGDVANAFADAKGCVRWDVAIHSRFALNVSGGSSWWFWNMFSLCFYVHLDLGKTTVHPWLIFRFWIDTTYSRLQMSVCIYIIFQFIILWNDKTRRHTDQQDTFSVAVQQWFDCNHDV